MLVSRNLWFEGRVFDFSIEGTQKLQKMQIQSKNNADADATDY
jgi:hypothetical protein